MTEQIRRLHLHDPGTAQQVLAVQRAAYAVEAALLGDDRIPPLHEDLRALVAAPLRWLGATDDGQLTGALAYVEDSDLVDVHRLVVDPERHRRGTGRRLVCAVLDATTAPRVTVATGRDNVPACRLYASLGFAAAGDGEVLPGLEISRWELRR